MLKFPFDLFLDIESLLDIAMLTQIISKESILRNRIEFYSSQTED